MSEPTESMAHSSDAETLTKDRSEQQRALRATPSSVQLLAYAAPVCSMVFLWIPTLSILPGLYAKYFNLKLTAVASVLLLSRVVDAVADPLVGYLSDRHRVAGGSRKTWVIAGGLALSVSSYFLFSPDPPVSYFYYLIWSLSFYLAWSLIDIPHAAWGAELVDDYNGRTQVYGYRSISLYIGLVAFSVLPFLPVFDGKEYTPQTLRGAVFIGAAFMLVALAASALIAPDGKSVQTQSQDSFREVVSSIVRNRPLLHFMATYFSFSLSYGMWTGLIFVYLDRYLNLGAKTAVIFLIFGMAALLSTPLWVRLVAKSSKSAVLASGIALFVVSLFCYQFIRPTTAWWIPLLTSCGVYVGVAAFSLLAPAILADVVDYGVLKFNRNRGSTYFALLTLSFKASSGLGAGLALGLTGYLGFDATSTVQSHTAIVGLRIGLIWLPALLGLIAFVLALLTPISKRRHEIIRQRLESRKVVRTRRLLHLAGEMARLAPAIRTPP